MASTMWARIARQGCRRISRSNQKHRQFCTSSGNYSDSKVKEASPNIAVDQRKTRVTTLENGLRVASERSPGLFCTIGVLIDSGSRYEVAYTSGISHFLEKLAFNSTTEYEDKDQILQTLARHGGVCDSQSSRDTFINAMSADTRGLPTMVNILAEVTLRPKFTEDEIEVSGQIVDYEIHGTNTNPNPQYLLMEMAHIAAYRGNTLGLPKICPEENIPTMDKKMLYTYLKNFHTPERMVVAGVGVDHDEFVKQVQEYFVDKKQPIWLDDNEIIDQSKKVDHSISQYTGGQVLKEKDLSNVSLGVNPMPELGHIVIGLESCSHKDSDFVSFCVLNMMLGGGGAFSAGGPGKGMFTRLYHNVLNNHHWINSATALNHSYEDSGMFCIHACSHPSKLKELTEVIVKELRNTTGKIHKEELNRAKVQLQSMLLMNLETKPVKFEDIGRQVLSTNERTPPEHYIDTIGKITEDDIRRVSERMLNSKPSVVGYGTLAKMPSYRSIESMLLGKPPKFSLFR